MTKEMIYKPQMHEAEVLESNTYNGFNYTVVSYGTHPCCYVEIPQTHPLFKKHYDYDCCQKIDCHGGVTFTDFKDFGDGEKWYIGWDYAHCNDYAGYYQAIGHTGGYLKKWTTEEMIQECKNVIDQLHEV